MTKYIALHLIGRDVQQRFTYQPLPRSPYGDTWTYFLGWILCSPPFKKDFLRVALSYQKDKRRKISAMIHRLAMVERNYCPRFTDQIDQLVYNMIWYAHAVRRARITLDARWDVSINVCDM